MHTQELNPVIYKKDKIVKWGEQGNAVVDLGIGIGNETQRRGYFCQKLKNIYAIIKVQRTTKLAHIYVRKMPLIRAFDRTA